MAVVGSCLMIILLPGIAAIFILAGAEKTNIFQAANNRRIM